MEHNGQPFTDVTKIRENETYQVVEAESKEKALEITKKPKGLLSIIPSNFNDNPISRALKINYNHSGEKRPPSKELIEVLKQESEISRKDSD
ncbi:DUF1381 domain-containing protein [Staphylococcus succinus]|uniref:DUF1381 domain-containing protein n=1 Tax=Staphylococcus succinus TaxID=61015 RepID=UPI00332E1CE0